MTTRTETTLAARAAAPPGRDVPLRLRGGWLALGRALYAGLLLICVVLFGLSLYIQFDAGVAPCTDPVHASWPFCEPFRQAQARLGLSPALYEGYFLGLRIVASLPLLGLISRLGQELETSATPDALLDNLVSTVAAALKLPYAAVEVDGQVLAAAGRPAENPARLPLVYQAQAVGHLLVGHRAPGEAFGPADRRLLETIAHQAGAAAQAVRLTSALQRSRQRIVSAREEERRRLRRDLHDGLGPQLASQTLGLDALERFIASEPDKARALIRELKVQAREAVSDVRRLVYGLRPPALDDFGLRGALYEEAARCREQGLQCTFEAPDPLPPLPAAVEVAAYRIVQEALHNAARHAGAQSCAVRLEAGAGGLALEVVDDGTGIPEGRRSGVGLQSMRERAAELNGTFRIEARNGGGTRVRAELPLYEPPTEEESEL